MSISRAAERAGADQQGAVIDRLIAEIADLAVSEHQRGQLLSILDGLQAHLPDAPRYRLGAVHVPLLIGEGLGSGPEAGVDIGAVTLALFLGIDLLDDVMDGDTSPYWSEPPPSKVMLAASTLLFSVAPALIARLPVDAERCRQLQMRISRCLMTMSDGQSADVGSFGHSVTVTEAQATVAAKSGEMLAAFAEVGAAYVGASPSTIAAAGRFGRSLALARQIGSDIYELVEPAGSADVRNAVPTLPVAHHLARLPNEQQRAGFLALLSEAGDSAPARQRLRSELVAGGGIEAALVTAELACAEAIHGLDELGIGGVAAEGLRELVDDASILGHLATLADNDLDMPKETANVNGAEK